MGDLINNLITIKAVEVKQGKTKAGRPWEMYKIQDQNGNKYSFFTTKVDGSDTKAFKTWKDLNVNIGQSVGVLFKEEEKEFELNGQVKQYTQRTIVLIEMAGAAPVGSVVTQPNPLSPATNPPAPQPKTLDVEGIPF